MSSLFVLDSDTPCPQCDGEGQRHNGRHCEACCGTGRMLVALGSVAAATLTLQATNVEERLKLLEDVMGIHEAEEDL